jgi:hypothetical protein
MRGIDRVLAVFLLVGAVGGAAAFARQSGNESASQGVALSTPPLQHVESPGAFFIAPRLTRPAKGAPARRVTLPQATLRGPVQAVKAQRLVVPPAPKQAPAPVVTAPPPVQAPPAPAPTPEPPRALASAQPAPVVQPEPVKVKVNGHGHGSGHAKHDEPNPAPEVPASPTVDVPVVLPSADDSSSDEHGTGGGNDHGHGSGHDQAGGPKHSGD